MRNLMPSTTKGGVMKRNILFLGFLFLVLSVKPAAAVTNGVIVRDTGGLLSLKSTCVLLGCNVLYGLDGAQGQVFLVTQKQSLLGTVLSLTQFIAELLLQPGVTNAEPDQILKVMQSSGLTAPNGTTATCGGSLVMP